MCTWHRGDQGGDSEMMGTRVRFMRPGVPVSCDVSLQEGDAEGVTGFTVNEVGFIVCGGGALLL